MASAGLLHIVDATSTASGCDALRADHRFDHDDVEAVVVREEREHNVGHQDNEIVEKHHNIGNKNIEKPLVEHCETPLRY